MLKIFKIVLLVLVMVSVGSEAKDVKWQKLKALHNYYSASDFNFREDVAAMVIKSYYIYDKHPKYIDKGINMKFYKTPFNLFDTKVIKKLYSATPNISKTGNIHKTSNIIANAFIIDCRGNILKMNEIVDVIGFMGKVDTPAEAQLILWLYSKPEGIKYRKISNGYTVIAEDIDVIDSTGHCIDMTYRINISQKGRITKQKLIKKKPGACLHGDPAISDTSGGI